MKQEKNKFFLNFLNTADWQKYKLQFEIFTTQKKQ